MVMLNTLVAGIHDGSVLDDIDFELLAHNNDDNKKMHFKGAYFILDNGYLNWSCTGPPFGVNNNIDEIRWSRWFKLMCLDVECTFGILKGGWRVLKSGVQIYGVDSVNYVWFTCCALHNWLLEIDGLSETWVGGIHQAVSNWDGRMGCLDFNGVRVDIPNAIACLSCNLDAQNYDSSGLGTGLDVIVERRTLFTKDNMEDANIMKYILIGEDCVQSVQYLSLAVFRRCLVNHFAVLFSQNRIVWPKWNIKQKRNNIKAGQTTVTFSALSLEGVVVAVFSLTETSPPLSSIPPPPLRFHHQRLAQQMETAWEAEGVC